MGFSDILLMTVYGLGVEAKKFVNKPEVKKTAKTAGEITVDLIKSTNDVCHKASKTCRKLGRKYNLW